MRETSVVEVLTAHDRSVELIKTVLKVGLTKVMVGNSQKCDLLFVLFKWSRHR